MQRFGNYVNRDCWETLRLLVLMWGVQWLQSHKLLSLENDVIIFLIMFDLGLMFDVWSVLYPVSLKLDFLLQIDRQPTDDDDDEKMARIMNNIVTTHTATWQTTNGRSEAILFTFNWQQLLTQHNTTLFAIRLLFYQIWRTRSNLKSLHKQHFHHATHSSYQSNKFLH